MPFVSNESSIGGGSSGSTSAGNATIAGMYFYHPDHLGSIRMMAQKRCPFLCNQANIYDWRVSFT